MKLHASPPSASNVFTAYGEGYVVVNAQRYDRTVVVLPERVWTGWEATSFEALAEPHFQALLALEREVILLGTGSRLRFPPPRLLRPLLDAGVGVEVMDVPAACRTYNILMAESRKVAAALLLP
jgi:uncharacterized protein